MTYMIFLKGCESQLRILLIDTGPSFPESNNEHRDKPKKEDLLCLYYRMRRSILTLALVASLAIVSTISVNFVSASKDESNITLTILVNRGKILIDNALDVLRNETNAVIDVKYLEFPYNSTRDEIIRILSNRTPVDIIMVDQIWLGEFAQKGFLTDLTNYTSQRWNRDGNEEWYFGNWEGGKSQGRIYGIWATTDIRGIWYWKDMLEEAGVDPNSLKTWDGYIAAAKKLNSTLNGTGI